MTVAVEEIDDSSALYRRIHSSQIILDENTKELRPSSGAFKQHDMSVDAEQLLTKHKLPVHFCIRNDQQHSLVKFTAAFARSQSGQVVVHSPVEENPAHTDVNGKKTGGIARSFAGNSEWVIQNPKL